MSKYIKSGIPRLSSLIQREHLLKKTSDILDHPLTIISSATGCGKTALASQFAEQIEADVVWHSISQYEQDLRVFLLSLLQNLEVVAPDIQSLRAIMQQPLETTIHEITTYLRENLTRDVLLVIDDWHLITTGNADNWLQQFVNTLPPRCHLLLISRRVPELKMIELIATRRLLNIQQQDLFFTRPEVYYLASRISAERPPNEQIEAIWEKLHGWPVGTILAFQPVTDILDSLSPIESGFPSVSEALFHSISSQMLTQELPDIQRFLTWTSTGEYFNEELCQDVFNIADYDFLISEVLKRNLFVTLEAGGYRYHQLFRNFLQAHFKLNHPEDYKSAHRRLAGWYQTRNKIDQAIDHYLLGDSIQNAVDLAERVAYGYYAQGRIDSITQLGQKLQPYKLPMPNTDHMLAQIYLVYHGDGDKALEFAHQSLAHCHDQSLTYTKYDVMITLGMIYQHKGDYDTATHYFHQVLDYENLADSLRGFALNQLGTTEHLRGNSNLAIDYLTQSLDLVLETSGLFHQAKVYQELELAYRDVGDVKNANDCLEKQIKYWQKLNNPEQLAMALNNLGYRYYEQGDYDLAYQTYQQGFDAIANLQSTRARYYLQASLGDLQRDRKQYNEARTTYQRALNLNNGQEPYAQIEVLVNLSTLYRWQSKYEAALTCADDAFHKAHDNNMSPWQTQAQIAQWHIRLQPWSLGDIQAEIDEALQYHPRLQSNPPIEFITLQWRMAILKSSITDIHSHLQHLTHRVNKEQSIQPFAAEVLNNHELYNVWTQIKHQYPQLEQVIERRATKVEQHNRILSFIPDTHSLHLFTLGIERIRKNNTSIDLSDMSRDLVREFLYYFVFMGGGTRDAISRIFWEDKTPDAQKDNFHQTLSRIRSALGNRIIIYDEIRDIYRFNPDVQLWCDALLLESIVKEAKRLSNENPHTFHLWYQATQLTYGEFLPGLDRDWIIHKRHYYQQLSIDAWMGLADYHRYHQDYRSALSAYEQIESFAPHHEAAYRARMECYSALGETASISMTYKALVQRLARDLQVQPSEQSHRLYKRLISSAS